jgi:hypothetical protein
MCRRCSMTSTRSTCPPPPPLRCLLTRRQPNREQTCAQTTGFPFHWDWRLPSLATRGAAEAAARRPTSSAAMLPVMCHVQCRHSRPALLGPRRQAVLGRIRQPQAQHPSRRHKPVLLLSMAPFTTCARLLCNGRRCLPRRKRTAGQRAQHDRELRLLVVARAWWSGHNFTAVCGRDSHRLLGRRANAAKQFPAATLIHKVAARNFATVCRAVKRERYGCTAEIFWPRLRYSVPVRVSFASRCASPSRCPRARVLCTLPQSCAPWKRVGLRRAPSSRPRGRPPARAPPVRRRPVRPHHRAWAPPAPPQGSTACSCRRRPRRPSRAHGRVPC